jgi:hypothetical protein
VTSTRGVLIGWCVILFFAGLFLYTRHNTFPAEFHADEPPKATQVIEGRPTYRQPLLLITTTEFVSRVLNEPKSIRPIVVTGRTISAVFAAGAVVFISLLGYLFFGESIVAAVAAGIGALSCPQLLLLAHYMKEDTALVFGGASFVAAVWLDERERSKRSAILLGIATGVLASAKYLGLLAVPIACWISASGRKSRQPASRRAFTIAIVASWCAINYLVVVNPLRFFSNLGTEAAHPVAGHHGLANPILLSSPVWEMLINQANLLVLILAVGYIAFAVVRRRRLNRAVWIVMLGPVAYLLLLSLSRFVLDRHLLPVTLAAYAMSGFAIAELSALLKRSELRWVTTAVLSTLLIATSITPARAIYRELKDETRLQLRAWIKNNLPISAVIAQDRPAHLNIADPEFLATYGRLPQKILTPRDLFVTDLGSVLDLRNQGVTHIVTCDEAYSRIFSEHVINTAERDEYRVRRTRYEEVFSFGKLLFEAKPERPIGGSTSPIVRVYAITGS